MAFGLDILRTDSFVEMKQELFQALDSYTEVFPKPANSMVLLKPNLNSSMNALTGNTTDLRVLSLLIQFLKEKGYTDITIGEGTNSGFYRNKIGVISRLNVDKLAAYFGIKIKDFNYSEPHQIEFEDGVKAQVAKECASADLFINLPKLKTHFEVGMSVCLKNLIGCLIGQENKKQTHKSLAANILRLNQQVKPHLHIVDGLIAMEGLGPTRGTPLRLDTLLVGTDPYLLDLCCAHLAGFDYRRVATLKQAEEKGLLTAEHHRIAAGLELHQKAVKFEPPTANRFAGFVHHPARQKYFLEIRNTAIFSHLAAADWFGKLLFLTGLRQDVFSKEEMVFDSLSLEADLCDGCGLCKQYCPLERDLPGQLPDRRNECLQCLYCFMICPRQAIRFEGTPGFLEEQIRQYDRRIRALHVSPKTENTKAIRP